MKPGKSQPFGLIDGKPVFVLSGNPAASSMGFELYVRLALRIMQGYRDLERPLVRARITADVRNVEANSQKVFSLSATPKSNLLPLPLQKRYMVSWGSIRVKYWYLFPGVIKLYSVMSQPHDCKILANNPKTLEKYRINNAGRKVWKIASGLWKCGFILK